MTMFGVILAGRPVLTEFTTISSTQLSITIPSVPHFSHIVVFLLPGAALPDGAAAAVYIQIPPSAEFKFLGAVGNEKQSAIFKVREGHASATQGGMEVEMTDGQALIEAGADITIGISLQDLPSIQNLLAGQTVAPIVVQPSVKDLAKHIMQNAFNFLASFADSRGAPGKDQKENVVPLKAFEEWWSKFEKKVDMDPGFLGRESG
jgi:hypothetical protein